MRGRSVLLLLLVTYYSAAHEGEEDNEPRLKIYGGDDAEPADFGFVVRIQYRDQFCGGSILSERVILTAAHCVLYEDGTEKDPETMEVIVGDYEFNEPDLHEKMHGVVRFQVHKDYDSTNFNHDIALLYLKKAITFDNGIKKIILPTNDDFYKEGTTVTMVGWGETENESQYSNILQVLEYEISDQEDCKEYWHEMIEDGMICTGKPPLNAHAWIGDSGGPLFVNDSAGNFIQVAVVTWGASKIDKDAYDVNTNVLYYKQWIDYFANEWIGLLGGSASSGVVVYNKVNTGKSYTVCNDGIGQNEVNLICAVLGYNFGIARHANDYKKNKKDDSFDKIPYVYELKCTDQAKTLDNCTWTQFHEITSATIPCISGEQVAVQCAESSWQFSVPSIKSKVKAAAGDEADRVHGKVSCGVKARKYGTDINIKNEVTGMLLNVNKEYEVELIVDKMKYKKKSGVFKIKIKGDESVPHHCFVCLAALKRYWSFHAYKVDTTNCIAEVNEEDAKVAVDAWIAEQILINANKDI